MKRHGVAGLIVLSVVASFWLIGGSLSAASASCGASTDASGGGFKSAVESCGDGETEGTGHADDGPEYVVQDLCIPLPVTEMLGSSGADLSVLGECAVASCKDGGLMQETVPMIDGLAVQGDASPGWCPSEQEAVDPLPGAVARAFAQVPVPAAVLSIQPPKGKTLVGLETIFSTDIEPFTRTLTLLGRRVELRITPTSFEWMHGDGTTQTSDWAGRAWDGNDDMDRYLTHTYEHTGTIHPTVTVTWTATWRLGNNPWQTVDGTVTKTGPRAELTVVEAEPELVAP